jgi:hypothetical protein
MFKKLFVLAAILSFSAFSCAPPGTIHKVVKHPELEPSKPVGYVEMWMPTSFGMWLKDLEEGPSTCGSFRARISGLDEGDYLCITDLPSWPGGGLSSMKYRALADNFSVCRFALPAGEHELFVVAGLDCYPPDERSKFTRKGYTSLGVSGTVYTLPVYPMDVEVEPDAIRLYQLALRRREGDLKIIINWSDVLLPVPEEPLSLDPDSGSYNALVEMLQDEGWGFRWYAARRIRYIGNESTLPVIEERLKVEEHKDVRNELEKALKKLEK